MTGRGWRPDEVQKPKDGSIQSTIIRRVQACHVLMPASHVALSLGVSVFSWCCAHCLCAVRVLCGVVCVVCVFSVMCLSLTLCVYLAVAVPCPLSPGVSWCCVSCAVRIRLALACSEWRWKAGRCPRESDHNLEMRTTGAYSRAHAKGKAETGTSRYAP